MQRSQTAVIQRFMRVGQGAKRTEQGGRAEARAGTVGTAERAETATQRAARLRLANLPATVSSDKLLTAKRLQRTMR